MATEPAAPEPNRPLSGLRLLGLAVATLVCITAFGRANLLEKAATKLTGEEALFVTPPPEPDAWDEKRGAELLTTYRALPALPSGARRIVMLGNSQQYTVPPPTGTQTPHNLKPRITSMRLTASLEAEAPGTARVYNSASDNQNFSEALWQTLYWLEVAPAKPTAFILQVSFDTLRKTGIRAGYQTLLGEPRFRDALRALLAKRERPYHPDWIGAEKQWRERAASLAVESSDDANEWKQWSPEPMLRAAMNHTELFRRREENKGFFLGTLYAIRVRALGISPRTKRHIAGAPLEQNLAALGDLLALAREHGCALIVYNAPTNPAVDMFYADEYSAYLERLRALTAAHGATFDDLGRAVPAEHWGYLIDGPDPIHFDEVGHAIVHEKLLGPLRASLGMGR